MELDRDIRGCLAVHRLSLVLLLCCIPWLWFWVVHHTLGRLKWQGPRYVCIPDLNRQPIACFSICLTSAAPFFTTPRHDTRGNTTMPNDKKVIGVFSMKPLLTREGLLVPCFVCTMLYVGASVVSYSVSLVLSPY